jgi:uncharacterized protein
MMHAVLCPDAIATARPTETAIRRIAPVWPLSRFVAVNPFLGLTDRPLHEVAAMLGRTAGARLTQPRAAYEAALAAGRINDADLAAALSEAGAGADLPADPAALRAAAAREAKAPQPLPLFSDVAAEVTGQDWPALAAERIGRLAADRFDAGQAAWAAGGGSLYAAWREEATLDRTPEILGLRGFRSAVAALPTGAEEAIAAATAALELPREALAEVYHRALMTIGGWAGHGRFRLWEAELAGRHDASLRDLLAIRLGWEVALLAALYDRPGVAAAWREAGRALAMPAEPSADDRIDAVLQAAAEHAWRRELFGRLASRPAPERAKRTRPAVQAVFCIDVRSEVFRRALERVAPEVETLGFAGFFGFPIEFRPAGAAAGRKQCPVLLSPSHAVHEDAAPDPIDLRRAAIGRAWSRFRGSAVGAFAFVETAGLGYLWRLVADGLGGARPAPAEARPEIARLSGTPLAERVALAEGALRGMSLTRDFARVVLLVGHGSTSRNNPHASGLDCGACGGHTGEANARVAALVLNDGDVRADLAARGIRIPDDTRFAAALHDTTTDVVTLLDAEAHRATHAADLASLGRWLEAAGGHARAERAGALDLPVGMPLAQALAARSRDWSQVRPEWGLAGCAAFVAAPRERTLGLDLGGRAFLHSYDWRGDEGFATLELILTAPVIVASWIALQYYGSAVDNRTFGSGNKVLHNVVGGIGVLEGNGGDLRPGLPWQSLHDGARLMHEPLRPTVIVEAPEAAMSEVIARHPDLRALLDNGWITLFAMDADGAIVGRYASGGRWTDLRGELERAA